MSYHTPSGYPGPQPAQGYPGAQFPSPGGGYPALGQHAPPPQQSQGTAMIDTTGAFEGAQYRIDHRDSNSLLAIRLQPGYEIKGKPGSMVAMDPTVSLKGKLKFSFKKLVTGTEMSESTFAGPGEVLLAPEIWGDIVPIPMDGSTTWSIGKHAFLAATKDVKLATKSQGFGKGLFSGEGLFVRQVTGAGVLFVSSLGAVVQRRLGNGEQWIVDNGHLVAWSAKYAVERVNAGGLISAAHTDEGLVCRFTGPGVVYIQTRNPDALTGWIQEQLPSSG
ncbi:unnamed protein product [Somion occarium]|uniref:Altered inheritance of mitochondria protein 24, mitochondrial n=1 Tax=Somion occarium TaxID=3059160 RepID=A0ABP1DJ26_9APHY